MNNCRVCNKEVNDNVAYWTTYNDEENPSSYICDFCFKEEKIEEYIKTRELSMSLIMDATSCKFYREESKDGFSRLREEVRTYYIRHQTTLYKIEKEYEEIKTTARELELVWWSPTLQNYYKNTDIRGHSAKGDGFEAMLWGSAGRVLLTLQDQYSKDSKESKFGGANITLIFDEESKDPRGGVQSLAATKDEVLALLKAAIKEMPKMEPNKKVTIGI